MIPDNINKFKPHLYSTTFLDLKLQGTKDLLRKLYNFFMMEKGMKAPMGASKPNEKTGIKQSTLRQYINGNDPVQDVVKSIHKAYVQKTVTKTQKVDDFDKGVVRKTIYDLHKKSQSLTMPKLQEALKRKTLTFPYLQCREQCIYWGFAFFEAKSHIDAERWAKFETRVVREFEEKLRKLDGIWDEDVNPVVIDMTGDDSDDSQKTIPYMISEGEEE
ncbi:USP25 [Mytilus coruscus]|uniref:USP25 n=1 Tax=Mytilus coruscus TaxID=42192 RepID=A0A6J8BX93_MYTCO|nr:USP25 [Mytilus coruscus]